MNSIHHLDRFLLFFAKSIPLVLLISCHLIRIAFNLSYVWVVYGVVVFVMMFLDICMTMMYEEELERETGLYTSEWGLSLIHYMFFLLMTSPLIYKDIVALHNSFIDYYGWHEWLRSISS